VIQVYDPQTGMTGILIIDNTAKGPGKGGIRIAENLTPYEIYRLARTMTWKCAIADLRLTIQGFGVVGSATAKSLSQRGARDPGLCCQCRRSYWFLHGIY
jgi:glutamate dehydrogenase/leucine dehydrogenase